MPAERSIEVQLAPELLRIFFPLLEEGVEVEMVAGCSIRELLIEQFGITAEYIASRITTVFVNHRAVDNMDRARIYDGAVLALSGAMPGLVGATMRSSGYYAAMRGNMTYRNEAAAPEVKSGTIKLKLFNLLLPELGPRLLQRGILLSVARWQKFLAQQPEQLRVRGYWLDEQPLPVAQLRLGTNFPATTEVIKLKVCSGDEAA
jgi:hypothetical protein